MLAAQQHHQVAAARPFMCAQPVLAIQTPAFMVASSSSSSSTGTQHAVQQQTLLLLCSLSASSSSSHLLASTVLDSIMDRCQCFCSQQHRVVLRSMKAFARRRKPYFGCDEAHSDLT